MKTYIIWNNKGGVGKSTITFNIAARFAELNTDKQVLVIDMCPQANVTLMLLGGGTQGEQNLFALQTSGDTIAGYIDDRISVLTQGQRSGKQFHRRVRQHNEHMPDNLWLVPGDGNLELLAPVINYYANAQVPAGAWVSVHQWVKELTQGITSETEQWVVFIDTNPSFSIYTELAIVAGNHLLVPFKADDSSRLAAKAMQALLHGASPPHPVYSQFAFATKAADNHVPIPLCHLFIGNQFTQYRGSASAFESMSEAVMQEMYRQYVQAPARYTLRDSITSFDDFRSEYVYELRDFNSAGVVAAHQGRLMSQLRESRYEVHGTMVPLDRGKINECRDSVDQVVAFL